MSGYHMTEMFARAHIAEARLEELMKHLKKVIVKRYDEVTATATVAGVPVTPTARSANDGLRPGFAVR